MNETHLPMRDHHIAAIKGFGDYLELIIPIRYQRIELTEDLIDRVRTLLYGAKHHGSQMDRVSRSDGRHAPRLR